MEILLMLLPISLLLVGAAIAIFTWAVNHGQFEDLERNAIEALEEPNDSLPKGEVDNE